MSPALHNALKPFRRRVCLLRLAKGGGFVATAAVVVVGGALLLDRSTVLSIGTRVGVTVVSLAMVLSVALWRAVRFFQPLRALDLARAIEAEHPDFDQCLSTAVALEQKNMPASECSADLQRAVGEEALKRLGGVSVRSFPARSGTQKAVVWGAVSVLLAALVVGTHARSSRLLWRRFVSPTSELARPSSVRLVVEPGDSTIRRGGSFEVHVAVGAGTPSVIQLWVREEGATWRLEQQLDRLDGRAASTFRLEGLESSLAYHVTGGDFQSADYEVRVRDPARGLSYEVTYREPAYTDRAPRRAVAAARQIVALRGTVVEIELEASEALRAVASRQDQGDAQEWQVDGPRAYSPPLELEQSGTLRLWLVGLDGVTNNWAEEVIILARPDSAPQIELVEPRMPSVRLDQDENFELQFWAEDDVGLASVHLVVEGTDTLRFPLPLAAIDGSGGEKDLTGHRLGGHFRVLVAELRLAPGEMALFYLEARDHLGQAATSARGHVYLRHAPPPPEGSSWLESLGWLAAECARLEALWSEFGLRLEESGAGMREALIGTGRSGLYALGVRLGEVGHAVRIPSRHRIDLVAQGRRLRRLAATSLLELERRFASKKPLQPGVLADSLQVCTLVHDQLASAAQELRERLEREEMEELHEQTLALTMGCRRLILALANSSGDAVGGDGSRRLSGILRRETVAVGASLEARLGRRPLRVTGGVTGGGEREEDGREARVAHALLEQIVPELDAVARSDDPKVARRHAVRARTLLEAEERTLRRLRKTVSVESSTRGDDGRFLADLERLDSVIGGPTVPGEIPLAGYFEWPLLELTEDIEALEKRFRPDMDGIFDLVALRQVFVQRARRILAQRGNNVVHVWDLPFCGQLATVYRSVRTPQVLSAHASRLRHAAELGQQLARDLPGAHGHRDLRQAGRIVSELKGALDVTAGRLDDGAAPGLPETVRRCARDAGEWLTALERAAARLAGEDVSGVDVQALVAQAEEVSRKLVRAAEELEVAGVAAPELEVAREWLREQLGSALGESADAPGSSEDASAAGEAAAMDELMARQAQADALFEQLLGSQGEEGESAEEAAARAELQTEVDEIAAEVASRLVTLKELMDWVAALLVLENEGRAFVESLGRTVTAAAELAARRDRFARRAIAELGGAQDLATRSQAVREPLAAALPPIAAQDAELRVAEHSMASGAQSAAHELLAWAETVVEVSVAQDSGVEDAAGARDPLVRAEEASREFVAALRALRVAALEAIAEVERAGAGFDSNLAISSRAESAARQAAEELRDGSTEAARRAHRTASRALSLAASRMNGEKQGSSGPPGAGTRTESAEALAGAAAGTGHLWRVLPRGAEAPGTNPLEQEPVGVDAAYPASYRTLVRLYREALSTTTARER